MRRYDEREMARKLKACREAGRLWGHLTIKANINTLGVPVPKPFNRPEFPPGG